MRDEAIDSALPAHLRQENHFPDVCHVDLLEWEQQGSAAEACADVLLDRRWPELVRRYALLARLTAFAVEMPHGSGSDAKGGAVATAARVRLAEQFAARSSRSPRSTRSRRRSSSSASSSTACPATATRRSTA